MGSFFTRLGDLLQTIASFLVTYKDVFSSAGTLFAVVIFGFAVFQYFRAETWKKSEFIAKLYKEFVEDPAYQRTMWMLDWWARPIDFGTPSAPVVIDYDHSMLANALRPHGRDEEFTSDEMKIRDTIDQFFNYIEQFERAMKNRLVKPKQVHPYFAYWIDLLAGSRHLPPEVRRVIFSYIDEYGFTDVRIFFARWGVT